jgi:hypothetical protein
MSLRSLFLRSLFLAWTAVVVGVPCSGVPTSIHVAVTVIVDPLPSYQVPYNEAYVLAKEGKRPMVLVETAPWCQSCLELEKQLNKARIRWTAHPMNTAGLLPKTAVWLFSAKRNKWTRQPEKQDIIGNDLPKIVEALKTIEQQKD